MDERDQPAVEDLDIAMTQAPQIFFIPYGLAVTLVIGAFAIGTKFHSWKVFLAMPVLWTLAALWLRRDHNALRVLHTKLRLLKVWLTAHRWGGWSVKLPGPRGSNAA
jgi:type IV secretory pathway VirB3-like protein